MPIEWNKSIEWNKPLESRKAAKVDIVFVILALLLTVWILGIRVWHGSGSPFNTLPGKLAFIGIFVGGPVYVYFRWLRYAGWVLLAISLVLWLFGIDLLVVFVSILSF